MRIIVCVDKRNGMMFNHRRQSQDREVRKRILEDVGDSVLWMNAYSRMQFVEPKTCEIKEDEAFLQKSGAGEWCFVENISVAPWEKRIERIICYRWERIYPADFWFDIPLKANGWKLKQDSEFKGFSHEKITKEIYIK